MPRLGSKQQLSPVLSEVGGWGPFPGKHTNSLFVFGGFGGNLSPLLAFYLLEQIPIQHSL